MDCNIPSVQASLMHLIHQYTSVNYKRLMKIGIHPGQLAFLKIIKEKEGISQRELAELLHVKAPTVAVTVKRLEKAEVIERRPDPKDMRVSRLYLKEKGKALAEEVIQNLDVNEKVVTSGFTEEEVSMLIGFLERMTKNLEQLKETTEDGEKIKKG